MVVASIVLRILTGPAEEHRRPVVTNDQPGAFARTLAPGTCTIEPYPSGYVRPTPCTEPHGSEIVAQLTYPAPPGGAFPPVQDAFARSLDLCEAAFDAYAGRTADQTPARFFVVLPSTSEWRGGERIVTCFADGRNGVELTTSVRASRP